MINHVLKPGAKPLAPERGFADPVLDAQAAFRALMWGMARPGMAQAVFGVSTAPAPLSPTMASVALALLDFEVTFWLDPALAAEPRVEAFLRFHTGAARTPSPGEASFAFVADAAALPPFSGFGQGTDAYPDRSTTIVAAVRDFDHPRRFRLEGPGVHRRLDRSLGALPDDFAARWAGNRALFPRGVDMVLAGPQSLVCLPRSVTATLLPE
jgi:alpha-D-ribose 1-methylphosphonate 5-triphosphate synthase subunit PhnH